MTKTRYDGVLGYDGCASSGAAEKENAHGMVEANAGDTVLSDPLHRMARTPAVDTRASPRVTIVVPVHNHWELTEACLERLTPLARHQNVEVLVINDGSTDDPPETWPSGEVQLIHKEHSGFAGACNYGALHAVGKYLIFLNNDTRPEPGWLKPLVDALEQGEGIVGPLLLFPDRSWQSAGLVQDSHGDWHNVTGQVLGEEVGGEVPAVTGACLAISRRLFWLVGGFDESFGSGGCCDVDLCLKAGRFGATVILEPKSVVIHNEGQTRFKEPDIQKQIARSQERLRARWGEDNALVTLPGTAAVYQPAGAADLSTVQDQRVERSRPLTVVWEGPQDAETGGSLGIINQAVTQQLRGNASITLGFSGFNTAGERRFGGRPDIYDAQDAWVSHYWPGLDGHQPPPLSAKHWLVIQPWEYGPPPRAWKATWLHARFGRLLAPSEYSRQLFLKYTLLKPEQVMVVPNGVDTSIFRPDGLRWPVRHEGITRFLFVGGVIWRKGIDLLEQAWSQAFKPGDLVRLTIKTMGRASFYRGQDAVDLEDWCKRRSDVRVFDEHLSQEDLAALYRTVDVLVAPSRAEGFCLPVLEAMASGCAVIVPQHGPTNEYTDDTCAIRARSEAWTDTQMHSYYEIPVDELAASLRWCVENPEALRKIRSTASAVAKLYSWENITSQYAQIIKEVCQ